MKGIKRKIKEKGDSDYITVISNPIGVGVLIMGIVSLIFLVANNYYGKDISLVIGNQLVFLVLGMALVLLIDWVFNRRAYK